MKFMKYLKYEGYQAAVNPETVKNTSAKMVLRRLTSPDKKILTVYHFVIICWSGIKF